MANSTLQGLRNWKAENAGKYGIVEMGVFGSVARGEETAESDVDVVVTMEKPNLLVMVGIKHDLEGYLKKSVDIIHSGTRNRYLAKRIEREMVVV
ncbi:MAG: nucleotidyltransferase domain-containing protein [Candidatus Dadabacteria bacterium]|nr:nucleotidyltransferase domain-containing protein [Candidatus Dadabacteria bacterium]